MNASQTQLKPYTALHLQHFPTTVFQTPSAEIHPMWSGEGNLSYLIVNPKTREALLIDPDLEILGSYLLTLNQQHLKLVAIFDTHTHAEHATAAPALKALTGCEYLMHHAASSSHISTHLQNEDSKTLGGIPVKFLHRPGHTPDLMVALIEGHLFTGDSLFNKSCGRADLPGGNPATQYESLQKLATLPDNTVVHPGHDYNDQLTTTIGEAKVQNPRLQFESKEAFVQFMNEFYLTNEKPDELEYYVAFNQR